MKKLIALTLALVLAFSLAGCNTSQTALNEAEDRGYRKGYDEGYAAAMEDLEYDLPSYILGRYLFNFLDDNNFLKLYVPDENDRIVFETALDYFAGEVSREDAVEAILGIWIVCDNLLEDATAHIGNTINHIEDKY